MIRVRRSEGVNEHAKASKYGCLSVVEYLLYVGADRLLRVTSGQCVGKNAMDLATKEAKLLLVKYEWRLCMVVCDELCEKVQH